MEFGQPQNFIWFWTLPATLAVFIISSLRKRMELRRLGEGPLVEKLVQSLDHRRRWIKRFLILGVLACIVTALCQPHTRTKETLIERKGVDVMIVVDVSNSMLAKDIYPNRLEKAKLELATLIDKLKGDRIGIVAFAGEAVIQCPLTLDKSAVKMLLSTLGPNLIPTQGTAIAAAIRVGTVAFAEKEKEEKAMILLTDGEDHEEDPLDTAKKAKKSGVRIYCIGIGTPEGSTIALDSKQFKKDRSGQPVISKLNENMLKALAKETGGAYYRSSRGELEVDRIVSDIRKMTQKSYKSDWSVEYEEHYQFFVLLAIILLAIETCLGERRKQ